MMVRVINGEREASMGSVYTADQSVLKERQGTVTVVARIPDPMYSFFSEKSGCDPDVY